MAITGRNANIPGTSGARLPAAPRSVPSTGGFPPLVRTGQIRDLGGHYSGGVYSAWLGFGKLAAMPAVMGEAMQIATERGLQKLQEEMVQYAQEYAPWNDVTGDARAELHSPPITKSASGDITLILAHGVDYGVYLETIDGGSFGIIPRTIQEFVKRVPGAIAQTAL